MLFVGKSLDKVAYDRSQKMSEQTGIFAQLMDADVCILLPLQMAKTEAGYSYLYTQLACTKNPNRGVYPFATKQDLRSRY